MDDPKCPVHPDFWLTQHPTTYGRGIVWTCPITGCTVRWWGGKNTTPADYATRKARMRAHAAIDPIWKSGGIKRAALYRRLRADLGIEHIGLCNAQECNRVIEWADKSREGDREP
jgi:hypothetical protein